MSGRGGVRMRAAVVIALTLLGGAVGKLGAQGGPGVQEAVLLPPRFFVGDRVELRLRLEVPAGVAVGEPLLHERGNGGPPAGGIEIHAVEVLDRRSDGQAGEVQVRIFFTSFSPGARHLPALYVGGLQVPEQEFVTASIREREPEAEFRPLRGQLLLPFTYLRLALAGVVLVGAPVTLAALGFWALGMLRRLRDLRRRRRPAQRARGALLKLEQGMQESPAKELFGRLSQVLKRYLAERLDIPTFSATTAEVEGLLAPIGVGEELAQRVQEVLRTADRVKFSGRSVKKTMATGSVKKVRDIVARVEEICDVGS